MSSSSPLSPKLLPVAAFGGDLGGFLEHVEQYRQYIELKKQMEKSKKNLLIWDPPQPSILNKELKQTEGPGSEHSPVDSTMLPTSPPYPQSVSTINSPVDPYCFFNSYMSSHTDPETEPDVRVRVAPVVFKPSCLFDVTQFTEQLEKTKKMILVGKKPHSLFGPNLGDKMSESSGAFVLEHDLKIRNLEELTNGIYLTQSVVDSSAKSLTCSICGRTMKNSSWLSAHIIAGHDKQTRNCSLCSYTCDIRKKLTQHIKSMHFKTFISKCSQCGKSFTTKQNYLRHNTNKCLTRSFIRQCSQCGKSFTTKRNYLRHNTNKCSTNKTKLNKRKKGRPVLCGICSTHFSRKSVLKRHQMKHHSNEMHIQETDKFRECIGCDFQYKTLENLKKHTIENHTGNSSYFCKSCSKCYSSSQALSRHKKQNHGKDAGVLYPCRKQGCKKMLKEKSSRERHMKTHDLNHLNLKPWDELSRNQKIFRLKKNLTEKNYQLESS